MTQFNDLLREAGIDPNEVRLLRHQTKPGLNGISLFDLWRDDLPGFEKYQSVQKAGRPLFRTARYWASFTSPDHGRTVFTGLYEARYQQTQIVDWVCPYNAGSVGGGRPMDVFETTLREELSEHIGTLHIDWNWKAIGHRARYAVAAPFPVVEGTLGVRTGPQAAHNLIYPIVGHQTGRAGANAYRRSDGAKEIGELAERAVLVFLLKLGGCAEIVHRAALGETPGWDIDYRDPAGAMHRVEVKGTEGGAFATIELTANEYRAAHRHGEQYWLFLVADCRSEAPRIQRICDPARRLTDGDWTASPALYNVRLRSR